MWSSHVGSTTLTGIVGVCMHPDHGRDGAGASTTLLHLLAGSGLPLFNLLLACTTTSNINSFLFLITPGGPYNNSSFFFLFAFSRAVATVRGVVLASCSVIEIIFRSVVALLLRFVYFDRGSFCGFCCLSSGPFFCSDRGSFHSSTWLAIVLGPYLLQCDNGGGFVALCGTALSVRFVLL